METNRKHTKKEFKQKIEWFIENKNIISRTRRNWYLSGMEERYSDFVPYNKYGYYGEGVKEYINDKIRKRMENNGN